MEIDFRSSDYIILTLWIKRVITFVLYVPTITYVHLTIYSENTFLRIIFSFWVVSHLTLTSEWYKRNKITHKKKYISKLTSNWTYLRDLVLVVGVGKFVWSTVRLMWFLNPNVLQNTVRSNTLFTICDIVPMHIKIIYMRLCTNGKIPLNHHVYKGLI